MGNPRVVTERNCQDENAMETLGGAVMAWFFWVASALDNLGDLKVQYSSYLWQTYKKLLKMVT